MSKAPKKATRQGLVRGGHANRPSQTDFDEVYRSEEKVSPPVTPIELNVIEFEPPTPNPQPRDTH